MDGAGSKRFRFSGFVKRIFIFFDKESSYRIALAYLTTDERKQENVTLLIAYANGAGNGEKVKSL